MSKKKKRKAPRPKTTETRAQGLDPKIQERLADLVAPQPPSGLRQVVRAAEDNRRNARFPDERKSRKATIKPERTPRRIP